MFLKAEKFLHETQVKLWKSCVSLLDRCSLFVWSLFVLIKKHFLQYIWVLFIVVLRTALVCIHTQARSILCLIIQLKKHHRNNWPCKSICQCSFGVDFRWCWKSVEVSKKVIERFKNFSSAVKFDRCKTVFRWNEILEVVLQQLYSSHKPRLLFYWTYKNIFQCFTLQNVLELK